MRYKPTICDTCCKSCNAMDKSRGMACKDYKKGVRESDGAGQRSVNRNHKRVQRRRIAGGNNMHTG